MNSKDKNNNNKTKTPEKPNQIEWKPVITNSNSKESKKVSASERKTITARQQYMRNGILSAKVEHKRDSKDPWHWHPSEVT